MVIIVQENYTDNLMQLPNNCADLLIVVYPEFAGAGISVITALSKLVLKEGGNLIIAPTLADAFLAL